MEITANLVKRLIREQFPQWSRLDVRPVARSGHDNRTFHLGETMAVRLPSGENYAGQTVKESRWLPYLQKHLDYPISKPIAVGRPTDEYPFPWSVNQWLEGETLAECRDADRILLAGELANALKKLQAVDCTGGPRGGRQNFFRGGDLKIYHQETVDALKKLEERLPAEELMKIWTDCIATVYREQAVWVHGDVAPGNILLQNGRFHGLIDFGVLGTGDPSCDYAMAWTYFDGLSREVFLENLDPGLISRARGWALWKALITYDDENEDSRKNARRTVDEIYCERFGRTAAQLL